LRRHEWTTQAYTYGIHVRHEKGKGRVERAEGRKISMAGAMPLYFGLAGTLVLQTSPVYKLVEFQLQLRSGLWGDINRVSIHLLSSLIGLS
jgi:hypothetical protein